MSSTNINQSVRSFHSSRQNLSKTKKNRFKTKVKISYSTVGNKDFNVINALRPEAIKKVIKTFLVAKKWTGFVTMTNEVMKIKSEDKIFHNHYDYNEIKGLFTMSKKSSQLLLVIERDGVNYVLIGFYDSKRMNKVIDYMSNIKGEPTSAINSNNELIPVNLDISDVNSMFTEDRTLASESERAYMEQMNVSNTGTYMFGDLSSDEEMEYPVHAPPPPQPIIKERRRKESIRHQQQQHHQVNLSEYDIDDMENDDLVGQWVAGSIYIKYDAKTRSNYASEDGSIYMFSCHSVLPYYKNDESDWTSDSE